jgi:hypothetical protein
MKTHLDDILKLLSELEPFGIRGVRHEFDEDDAGSWLLDVEKGVTRVRICWHGFADYDMSIRRSSYHGADGTWEESEIIDRTDNRYVADFVVKKLI